MVVRGDVIAASRLFPSSLAETGRTPEENVRKLCANSRPALRPPQRRKTYDEIQTFRRRRPRSFNGPRGPGPGERCPAQSRAKADADDLSSDDPAAHASAPYGLPQ